MSMSYTLLNKELSEEAQITPLQITAQIRPGKEEYGSRSLTVIDQQMQCSIRGVGGENVERQQCTAWSSSRCCRANELNQRRLH